MTGSDCFSLLLFSLEMHGSNKHQLHSPPCISRWENISSEKQPSYDEFVIPNIIYYYYYHLLCLLYISPTHCITHVWIGSISCAVHLRWITSSNSKVANVLAWVYSYAKSIVYSRGVKHTARGPEPARKEVRSGPRDNLKVKKCIKEWI